MFLGLMLVTNSPLACAGNRFHKGIVSDLKDFQITLPGKPLHWRCVLHARACVQRGTCMHAVGAA